MDQPNLQIRTRSSGPKIRAGLTLGTIRDWAIHEIERTFEGLEKLLACAKDPKVIVQANATPGAEDPDWQDVQPEQVSAYIDALKADADAPVNTILPTAEPTLERAAAEDTHAGAEGAGGAVVGDAATDAPAEGEAPATDTAATDDDAASKPRGKAKA